MSEKSPVVVNNLAQLKALKGAADTIVFMTSRAVMGDSQGGFFWFDEHSTEEENLTYLSIVKPTGQDTGRWKRVFDFVKVLPHGTLVTKQGIKTFYAQGMTNANGEITLNLTLENTANGTAMFSQIWFNDSKSTVAAASPSNAVTSYVKSLSANLKTTTHGYFRANAVTISLGLLYAPFAAVPANVPIQFQITGI